VAAAPSAVGSLGSLVPAQRSFQGCLKNKIKAYQLPKINSLFYGAYGGGFSPGKK